MLVTKALEEIKENVDYTRNDFEIEQQIEQQIEAICDIRISTCSYEETENLERENYEVFFKGGTEYVWNSSKIEVEISDDKVSEIIKDYNEN